MASAARLEVRGQIAEVKSVWFQQRGKSGLWVSELFPHLAGVADELTVIRSMWSGTGNHTPATLGHQFAIAELSSHLRPLVRYLRHVDIERKIIEVLGQLDVVFCPGNCRDAMREGLVLLVDDGVAFSNANDRRVSRGSIGLLASADRRHAVFLEESSYS